MNLRQYQLDALDASVESLKRGVNKQLIVMPTGTGKTCVFAALRNYHGFKKRVMVLVHRDELAQQAADKLRRWNHGARVGIEQAEQVCPDDADFVVASVQTIGRNGSRRIEKFSPDTFDALVIDEAHHATATSYINVINHFAFDGSRRLLLGVTATPNRGDGSGLGKVFDEIVYEMSIPDAIKNGWLVDLVGVRVQSSTSLDGIKTVAGDFEQGELGNRVNTPERNRMIVREWMKLARDRKTIAYSVNIQHAKDLANAFVQAGVKAAAVWGDDPERQAKLHEFANGDLQVLVNCGVLVEGYDCWKIACVVLGRPSKSPLIVTQQIGRGTRLPDGINNLLEAPIAGVLKRDCLVMDVVDNTTRHSIITLPSLFGLGDIDVEGQSVLAAKAELDAAMEKVPGLDLSTVRSLSDLKAKVEAADLLTVKFAPAVTANSELQWHRGPDNSYILLLPRSEKHKNENVVILQDLLDKFTVVGTIKGVKYVKYTTSLGTAFRMADALVRQHAPELLRILRQKARWHDDPATQAQINMLRKLRIPVPNGITKGSAAKLITQFFARRTKVAAA